MAAAIKVTVTDPESGEVLGEQLLGITITRRRVLLALVALHAGVGVRRDWPRSRNARPIAPDPGGTYLASEVSWQAPTDPGNASKALRWLRDRGYARGTNPGDGLLYWAPTGPGLALARSLSPRGGA